MVDHTYDEYLKWLSCKADKWYKKLFVSFVKKYFPEFMAQQYRKWLFATFMEEASNRPGSYTSITSDEFDKLAKLMKH